MDLQAKTQGLIALSFPGHDCSGWESMMLVLHMCSTPVHLVVMLGTNDLKSNVWDNPSSANLGFEAFLSQVIGKNE
jgi:hypothetical protein